MSGFKVGDKVDVFDQGTLAVVDRGATIMKLEDEGMCLIGSRWVATLDCGYVVTVGCLRRAQ